MKRLTLRLPDDLHERLTSLSWRSGYPWISHSLNKEIVRWLELAAAPVPDWEGGSERLVIDLPSQLYDYLLETGFGSERSISQEIILWMMSSRFYKIASRGKPLDLAGIVKKARVEAK